MDVIKFPVTNTALWYHQPVGSPVFMHIAYYRLPVVLLEERSIRLAHRFAQDYSGEIYPCHLIASVHSDPDAEGIKISIEHLDPEPKHTSFTAEDLHLNCMVKYGAAGPKDLISSESFVQLLQRVEEGCGVRSQAGLVDVLAGMVTCYSVAGQPNIVYTDIDLVLPSLVYKATPIQPVPVVVTALSKNLSGPLSLSEVQGEPKSGYLTMDQTRKLLLILESDPKATSLPLVGIWVSGVSVVHDPFVWRSCLRYQFSSHLKHRVCQAPEPVLIVLYSPLHSKPQFYECVPKDGKPDLKFDLYSCHEILHLPKTSPDRPSSPLELELSFNNSGKKFTVFEAALQSFNTKKVPSVRRQSTDSRGEVAVTSPRRVNLEDSLPWKRPAPHPTRTAVVQPSVPEVTLLFEESTPQPITVKQPITVGQTPQHQWDIPVGQQTAQHQQNTAGQTPQHYSITVGQTPQNQPVTVGQAPQHQPVTVGQILQHQPVTVGQILQHQAVTVGQTLQHLPVTVGQTPQHQPIMVGQTPQPSIQPFTLQVRQLKKDKSKKTAHRIHGVNSTSAPGSPQVVVQSSPVAVSESHSLPTSPHVPAPVQAMQSHHPAPVANNQGMKSVQSPHAQGQIAYTPGPPRVTTQHLPGYPTYSNSLGNTAFVNLTPSPSAVNSPQNRISHHDSPQSNMPTSTGPQVSGSHFIPQYSIPQRQQYHSPVFQQKNFGYQNLPGSQTPQNVAQSVGNMKTTPGLQLPHAVTPSESTPCHMQVHSPAQTQQPQGLQPAQVATTPSSYVSSMPSLSAPVSTVPGAHMIQQNMSTPSSGPMSHVPSHGTQAVLPVTYQNVASVTNQPMSGQSVAPASSQAEVPGAQSNGQLYELLRQQDAQIQMLREQIAQLLANQKSPAEKDNQQSDMEGSEKQTCTVACNTSLWLSGGQQSQHTASQYSPSHEPSQNNSHDSSSNRDQPDEVSCISLGEMDLQLTKIQDNSQESVMSNMFLDMPDYGPVSPDRSGNNTHSADDTDSSPVLGESVSMYQQYVQEEACVVPEESQDTGLGDSQQHTSLLFNDQRLFYRNMMENVYRHFLHEEEVEQLNDTVASAPDGAQRTEKTAETPVRALDDCLPTPRDTPSSRRPRPGRYLERRQVNIADKTKQALEKMGVQTDKEQMNEMPSDRGSMYLDTTLLPHIQYMSMFLDSDSDGSADMDALAMKYLKDDQLADLAKLQGRGNKLDKLAMAASSNVSLWQHNNMSFASRKYLERYGLVDSRNQSMAAGEDSTESLVLPDVLNVQQFLEKLHEHSLQDRSLNNSSMQRGHSEGSFDHLQDTPDTKEMYSVAMSDTTYNQTRREEHHTPTLETIRQPPDQPHCRILDIERLRELPKLL